MLTGISSAAQESAVEVIGRRELDIPVRVAGPTLTLPVFSRSHALTPININASPSTDDFNVVSRLRQLLTVFTIQTRSAGLPQP